LFSVMHSRCSIPTLATLVVAGILLLAGCLPSSGRRSTQGMFASDSLSREVVQNVAVDSLYFVAADNAEGRVLDFPTTIQLDPGGDMLLISDTQRERIVTFSLEARHIGEWPLSDLAYPFLAGSRGDTVAVMNRGNNRLDYIVAGRRVRSIEVPGGDYPTALLTETDLWIKRLPDSGAEILRLTDSGGVAARHELPGANWRHFGFVRPWGNDVMSLSGYRPVIDIVSAGGAVDTLALVGFDSPQFVRSYQFAIGEVKEPPLLTSTALAMGDNLFVANLRDSHVRIDVYDRQGRIQRILASSGNELPYQVFTVDMVAWPVEGGVRFALLVLRPGTAFMRPSGRVIVFEWRGDLQAPQQVEGDDGRPEIPA
jgi:hypothetical protein